MNDETMPPDMPADDLMAAEYALGLLEGEELLTARGRLAREPDFADAVARWEDRLAPMLDEIAGMEPGPELWQRIKSAIDRSGGEAPSAEIIALRGKVKRYQWATGIATAAAAVALAFVALPQGPQPGPGELTPAPQNQAPMMAANFPIEGTPLRLDLTYMPDKESVLVTAIGLTPDGVHDHEIWLVPDEGDLISLGVVTPGEVRAHSVPTEVAEKIHSGSRLLLTREPLGGKPEGEAAGPVVSEGAFDVI
ncbi:Anti-sigma-K factor RskA [Altererythrobacter xiamenensis]|uniref:Anti-sigma-K factor RskA n=1 Tax=Altererythrobacter xiamenensis TaxID=1316679 RepID=A0A1Y6EIU8_9SPHN|nr:anti-sigma factor [Altererythrobacter xiamenensis]SMQ62527.1 Anti-sigma-K factor RskA [Altererythrobacter xiamenensis]